MFTHSPKTDSDKIQSVSARQDKTKTLHHDSLREVLANPDFLVSPQNILQLQLTIGNRDVIQLLESQFQQQNLLQPVQRMEFEGEELQMKRDNVIQRAEVPEDEDELQMKPEYGAIQRVELPDEEELQMKQDNTIQRAEISEDEILQMKKDNIFQRKEIEITAKKINNTINPLAIHPKIVRLSLFQPPIQKKNDQIPEHRENNTGMPNNLKSGLEALSGLELSDLHVHRNSDKPQQVGALAYTQGTDIHVAPGQEQHLPHEGWHVVQQKQGRVQATTQAAGFPVNDDPALEKEADVMGEKALQMKVGIVDTCSLKSKFNHGVVRQFVITFGQSQKVRTDMRTSKYGSYTAERLISAIRTFITNHPNQFQDIVLDKEMRGKIEDVRDALKVQKPAGWDAELAKVKAAGYKEIKGNYGVIPADTVEQVCQQHRISPQTIKTSIDKLAAEHGDNGVKILNGNQNYTAELKIMAMGDDRIFSTTAERPYIFDTIAPGLH